MKVKVPEEKTELLDPFKTASVKVRLPDGWELADEEMRAVKQGEWILTGSGIPFQARSDEGVNSYIILRRKLPDTVKVELPRDDVEANQVCGLHEERGGPECDGGSFALCRLAAACREALKAEQQT